MTDTPQVDRTVRRIGRRMRRLEANQARAARASQAGQRSVEDGDSVMFYDEDGTPRVSVGAAPDGSFTSVDLNGAPLNRPSAPLIAPLYQALAITWDGFDEFAESGWPADFRYVEVHASTVPGYVPDDETQVESFGSRMGGTVQIPVPSDVPLYVCLVAVNTSGVESVPSVEVEASSTDVLDRPTIYGGAFSTADAAAPTVGQRVVLRNDASGGLLEAFTGGAKEAGPTTINPYLGANGQPGLQIKSGASTDSLFQAEIVMQSATEAGSAHVESIITLFAEKIVITSNEGVTVTGPLVVFNSIHGLDLYADNEDGSTPMDAELSEQGRVRRKTSSRRFKDNITAMTLDQARRVLSFRPVTYTRKPTPDGDDTQTVYPGLIAEEVAEAGGDMWVPRDMDGQPVSVRYAELTPALIALAKDADERIAALEQTVNDLKERLAAVE